MDFFLQSAGVGCQVLDDCPPLRARRSQHSERIQPAKVPVEDVDRMVSWHGVPPDPTRRRDRSNQGQAFSPCPLLLPDESSVDEGSYCLEPYPIHRSKTLRAGARSEPLFDIEAISLGWNRQETQPTGPRRHHGTPDALPLLESLYDYPAALVGWQAADPSPTRHQALRAGETPLRDLYFVPALISWQGQDADMRRHAQARRHGQPDADFRDAVDGETLQRQYHVGWSAPLPMPYRQPRSQHEQPAMETRDAVETAASLALPLFRDPGPTRRQPWPHGETVAVVGVHEHVEYWIRSDFAAPVARWRVTPEAPDIRGDAEYWLPCPLPPVDEPTVPRRYPIQRSVAEIPAEPRPFDVAAWISESVMDVPRRRPHVSGWLGQTADADPMGAGIIAIPGPYHVAAGQIYISGAVAGGVSGE